MSPRKKTEGKRKSEWLALWDELAGIEMIRTTRMTPEVTARAGTEARFGGTTTIEPVLSDDGQPRGVIVSKTNRDGTQHAIRAFVPHHNIKAYQFGDLAVTVESSDAVHSPSPTPAPVVNDEELLSLEGEGNRPRRPRKTRPPLKEMDEPNEDAIAELDAYQAEIDATKREEQAFNSTRAAVDEEVLGDEE